MGAFDLNCESIERVDPINTIGPFLIFLCQWIGNQTWPVFNAITRRVQFFDHRDVSFYAPSEENVSRGVILLSLRRLQNLSKALLKRLSECCCWDGRLELLAG